MLRWTDGAGTARACSDEFVFAPKLRGAERRAVHTLPVLTLFASRQGWRIWTRQEERVEGQEPEPQR